MFSDDDSRDALMFVIGTLLIISLIVEISVFARGLD